MENNMRRNDRAVPDSEARELLAKGEYGVLSTASLDGRPYGVPLNYGFAGDAIYFHCALEGRKRENIRANEKVSFCVVGRTEVVPEQFATRYESVIVSGRAAEVTGEERQKGFVELLKKYSPGSMKEGLEYIDKAGGNARVYKITIESITGKARR